MNSDPSYLNKMFHPDFGPVKLSMKYFVMRIKLKVAGVRDSRQISVFVCLFVCLFFLNMSL